MWLLLESSTGGEMLVLKKLSLRAYLVLYRAFNFSSVN